MIFYKTVDWLYRLRDLQKHRRVLSGIEELESYFEHAETCFQQSSDMGLAALNRIRLAPPKQLPRDPCSTEYADAQMSLYLKISGRKAYSAVESEKSDFDFERLKDKPYPFFTQSPNQVWEQYSGIGHLIRSLNPHPQSKILEFGSGWGNVAIPLAQMGHEVTCVEIDTLMVNLLHYRSQQLKQNLEIIQTDMLKFDTERKFDAIVFYESFHHCLNHLKFLDRLPAFLKDGGKVIFAGEPISIFQFPWGLRLDGLSLWSIRKYGWFELGFSRPYFYKTLMDT